MIVIKPVDRHYLVCRSCETKENVLNFTVIEEGGTHENTIRLCAACIKEGYEKSKEYTKKDRG